MIENFPDIGEFTGNFRGLTANLAEQTHLKQASYQAFTTKIPYLMEQGIFSHGTENFATRALLDRTAIRRAGHQVVLLVLTA